ncbi:MAG TPA: hypothetical protein VNY10_03600 [Roseiarcus sp.]|nr:hypothetical protein [Roseiarcus sp.]
MYNIVELPGLDDATPAALNDNGDVAGYAYGAIQIQGIIWYGDGSTLVLPSNEFSVLTDIDQDGTAVGWTAQSVAGPVHAIMVQNKITVDLGAFREATCINSPDFGESHLLCLTDGAGVLAVDPATQSTVFTVSLAGYELDPAAVNNNGDIAGRSLSASNPPVSFLYRNGAVANDTPANGGILKLNNFGQGGGYTGNPSVGPQPVCTPTIWDITGQTPTPTPVQLLPGLNCGYVFGINDKGVAVGSCSENNFVETERAFLYDGNKTTDLNTLIDAPGWLLREANAINNFGQIAGFGIFNGAGAAFLLTPISYSINPNNINALLWAMLFGGIKNDGGGPELVAGHIPDWVGPLGPSILSPAAQDVVVGLAVDAVARRLGDQVGKDAIRTAALEMAARAIERLKTAERPPARPAARLRRRDPWRRTGILRPSRLRRSTPEP